MFLLENTVFITEIIIQLMLAICPLVRNQGHEKGEKTKFYLNTVYKLKKKIVEIPIKTLSLASHGEECLIKGSSKYEEKII